MASKTALAVALDFASWPTGLQQLVRSTDKALVQAVPPAMAPPLSWARPLQLPIAVLLLLCCCFLCACCLCCRRTGRCRCLARACPRCCCCCSVGLPARSDLGDIKGPDKKAGMYAVSFGSDDGAEIRADDFEAADVSGRSLEAGCAPSLFPSGGFSSGGFPTEVEVGDLLGLDEALHDVLVDEAPTSAAHAHSKTVRAGPASQVCSYEELGEPTLSDLSADDFDGLFETQPTTRNAGCASGAHGAREPPACESPLRTKAAHASPMHAQLTRRRAPAAHRSRSANKSHAKSYPRSMSERGRGAKDGSRAVEKRSLLTDVDVLVS